MLSRIFQQIFHVKAVPHDPELLDLEASENEEFSPDKLRAALERLYMTVVCNSEKTFSGYIAESTRLLE